MRPKLFEVAVYRTKPYQLVERKSESVENQSDSDTKFDMIGDQGYSSDNTSMKDKDNNKS